MKLISRNTETTERVEFVFEIDGRKLVHHEFWNTNNMRLIGSETFWEDGSGDDVDDSVMEQVNKWVEVNDPK